MTRDEFMDLIYSELHSDGDNNRANRIIDAADSYAEDCAPHWIPCSERMPDVAQRVLLSAHGMVMVGMLHSFGKYRLEPTGFSYVYPKDKIDAWMPLPEPYKGKKMAKVCEGCKYLKVLHEGEFLPFSAKCIKHDIYMHLQSKDVLKKIICVEDKVCRGCEYLKIVNRPEGYELGVAECTKHGLVTDFRDMRKFNKLKCVEGEK